MKFPTGFDLGESNYQAYLGQVELKQLFQQVHRYISIYLTLEIKDKEVTSNFHFFVTFFKIFKHLYKFFDLIARSQLTFFYIWTNLGYGFQIKFICSDKLD